MRTPCYAFDLPARGPVATIAPGSPASVTVQDTAPVAPETPRRFLRVRAVGTP